MKYNGRNYLKINLTLYIKKRELNTLNRIQTDFEDIELLLKDKMIMEEKVKQLTEKHKELVFSQQDKNIQGFNIRCKCKLFEQIKKQLLENAENYEKVEKTEKEIIDIIYQNALKRRQLKQVVIFFYSNLRGCL